MSTSTTSLPVPAMADPRVVRALVALLVVTCALRLALVAGGGQWFWADESRYVLVLDGVRLIVAGDLTNGLKSIAGSADHLGFKLLGIVPAAIQLATGSGLALPAALYSLASTLNVLLVFLIARRAGADGVEAFGAALAMACSNAMFYWSRHLMPYDAALAFGLALVYVALKPNARLTDALLAGALGFAVFATYNGYWTLTVVGFAIHAGLALPRLREAAKRCAGMVAGCAGSAAIVVLAAQWLVGVDLIASWRGFAGTVTQGDFDEGHAVALGYLWQAERALVVVWLVAAAALPLAVLLGRHVEARSWLWLACAFGVLALLVVGSNLLHQFVVYGRLARQSVPFLSLLVGYTLFGPWRHAPRARALVPVAAVLLVAIAAANFAKPLRLEFPAEFMARGRAALAVHGISDERHRFVNAKFMWPRPEPFVLPERSRVLLHAPHPLQYRPYLYEGFDRHQRATYRAADLAMRLVVLE